MIVGNRDCRAPGARTHKGVRADDHLLIWTSHPNPLGKSLWIRTPPARVALVFAFLRCVPQVRVLRGRRPGYGLPR